MTQVIMTSYIVEDTGFANKLRWRIRDKRSNEIVCFCGNIKRADDIVNALNEQEEMLKLDE